MEFRDIVSNNVMRIKRLEDDVCVSSICVIRLKGRMKKVRKGAVRVASRKKDSTEKGVLPCRRVVPLDNYGELRTMSIYFARSCSGRTTAFLNAKVMIFCSRYSSVVYVLQRTITATS